MNNVEKTETLEEIRKYLDRSREIHSEYNSDGGTTTNYSRAIGKNVKRSNTRRSERYGRSGKKSVRQNRSILSSRHNRPSTRLVSRGRNPPRSGNGNKRNSNLNRTPVKRKKPKRKNVPINKTVSFEKGIVFREPSRGYSDNGNCCKITGVEYVTQVSVNTTANTTPGVSGDIIYTLPLAPICLPGTDLYKEAQFWEKWRWNKVHIHYIPSCPSTTNGALIGWAETDIGRATFGILSDGASRVREALARKSAKMFHPFTEVTIEMARSETDKNLWYDTYIDEESELSIPSQLFIMLESGMTDPNLQATMSCGQILIDYEIEFCDKSMIDGPIPTAPVTTIWSGTGTTTFNGVTTGSGVRLRLAVFGQSSFSTSCLYIIVFNKKVFDVTTAAVLPVQSRYNGVSVDLGYQGCVLYGFCTGYAAVDLVITPSIEDAIMKSAYGNFTFQGGLAGTDTVTMTTTLYAVDLSDLL